MDTRLDLCIDMCIDMRVDMRMGHGAGYVVGGIPFEPIFPSRDSGLSTGPVPGMPVGDADQAQPTIETKNKIDSTTN